MKQLLDFLTDLKHNNNKQWFDANRDRYEESKTKMLFFTEIMIREIHTFDPEIPLMDPKDCLFRIFRDVRFSNDKSPYKTHMGSFIARGGRKSTRAGYYIHLEPDNSFLGGGVWCPQANQLKAIRWEIHDHPEAFRDILNDPGFNQYFKSIEGEKLKTAPQGFDKDFEAIDLLRYKSYAFGVKISDQQATGTNIIHYATDVFTQLHKANRYLNSALDKWS